MKKINGKKRERNNQRDLQGKRMNDEHTHKNHKQKLKENLQQNMTSTKKVNKKQLNKK